MGLIGRMLERGREDTVDPEPALPGTVIPARFARDPDHFAIDKRKAPHPGIDPDPSSASDANLADDLSADRAGEVR